MPSTPWIFKTLSEMDAFITQVRGIASQSFLFVLVTNRGRGSISGFGDRVVELDQPF